jgi:molybdopterin converting factor small subunit
LKTRPLAAPTPLRSTTLPWNAREVLPPDDPARRKRARDNKPTPPSAEPETYTLVDVLAEDAKMSKGKARLAIQKGQVSVNDVIVRDPDTRLSGADVVRFFPPSKIHVTP